MNTNTSRHGAGDDPAVGARRHPAMLKVGVVGPGRVGTAIGTALARAGHRVVAVSAISDTSLRRAHRSFPGVPVVEPGAVVAAADLVLLTVPDDALPELVRGLVRTRAPVRGRLVAHASGRYGVDVLDPAARCGCLPLALHPVMTFTGRGDDVDKLRGVCFGVTAPETLRPVAEALVLDIGGEPVAVSEANRGLYHAALTGAANHLVTLVTQSVDLLRGAGVADPVRMVGPLLSAALDNALRLGDEGLTGPVARGDVDTVASHVAALREAAPDALAAYLALARLTADRALAAGLLDPSDASRLLCVLASANL